MVEPRARDEVARLVVFFLVWKTFLLVTAYSSPGLGYDTSTTLLGISTDILPNRLVRWDAIYYTKVAQRDYLFEQEWAFGWGYTRVLKLIATLFATQDHDFPLLEAWSGIIISHVSHLVSVLALYDTSRCLLRHTPGSPRLPCVASILHIVSPAGLFLSAPYGESLFSCLCFLAYDLYVRTVLDTHSTGTKNFYQLISAILFSLSVTIRSNGLLNGLIFVSEAVYGCIAIFEHGIDLNRIRRLAVVGLCGSIVGLGYIIPQFVAYREYCSASNPSSRPWCNATLPSIYNFVQSHYWNTGLFKYWTISNLPLFLIGAPSIALFIKSSHWAWDRSTTVGKTKEHVSAQYRLARRALQTLALPQIALVVLVLTSFHVQIITRLSSGYPVWYWWLAEALSGPSGGTEHKTARAAVAFMVLYAAIQGALFANFLPPA